MTKSYLTIEQVIDRYNGGINRQTLANWRQKGKGPTFTKVGRNVFYPLDLLEEWESQRTFNTLSNDA